MSSTKIATIDAELPEAALVREAVDLLIKGRVIAFPTETVYGLGAGAFYEKAVESIYAMKGRVKNKPFQVMIAHLNMLEQLTAKIPKNAKRLMDEFWPGPLTLVLPAKPSLSPLITAGKSTVAIRFPSHPVPVRLIQTLGQPMAATSANRSGHPSPVTAEEVYRQLQGKIPLILDGGRCLHAGESTIVDCTKQPFTIIRPGAIPDDMIFS